MQSTADYTPAFVNPFVPGLASKGHVAATSRRPPRRKQPAVTMLRVQKKRQPEDWEAKMTTLSGRFLPMDPRDERVLDVLESENSRSILVDISQNPDGPAGPFSDSATRTKKWSKRSEAARKRWADPAYRAKMLAKRAAKRRLDADAEGKQHRLEIGCMDSITLCDDDKAKAINDYVRSNKLRSEKLSAFHQNTKEWMENRLSEGRSVSQMSDEEYVLHKKEQRERRRQSALKRVRNIKEKKKKEQAASRATHK